MKKLFLFFVVVVVAFKTYAQELLCNVRVNSSQVQTSDRKVFQTMQKEVYEFINNRKWTSTNIQNEERIECSILINISKRISNDEFEGSIQIQSTRPIYGTSYKSTLFNFLDNNFRFKYLEYQSLEFSESTHMSNLTSVLAFYVNIILGLDFATFSEDGSYEYFNKAQITSFKLYGNIHVLQGLGGNILVSIGKDGVLLPGIPIGEVKLSNEMVEVKLLTDINQILYVDVILNKNVTDEETD